MSLRLRVERMSRSMGEKSASEVLEELELDDSESSGSEAEVLEELELDGSESRANASDM